MSFKASSVTDVLSYEAGVNNIDINLNTTIEDISILPSQKFLLNNTMSFDIVIMATGSLAMSKLGGTSLGYDLLKKLNYETTPIFPSLVQLVSDDKDIKVASGVKIDAQIANIKGDLLFTDYGVSGNIILDISREFSQKLNNFNEKSIPLTIDLLPSISKDKLNAMLIKRLNLLSNKKLEEFMDGFLNRKLWIYILLKSNIPYKEKLSSSLSRKDILKIVYNIKSLNIKIVDTKGFEHCEVCAGGIDTRQINENTMESKKHKNLFVLGELLDVDGDCGGYNLHWAWATAYSCSQFINKI